MGFKAIAVVAFLRLRLNFSFFGVSISSYLVVSIFLNVSAGQVITVQHQPQSNHAQEATVSCITSFIFFLLKPLLAGLGFGTLIE